MAMALACAGNLGTIGIVGAGGGTAKVSWGVLPLECDLFIPMAASIADLHEVIALAEAGELRVEVELFAFEDAPLGLRPVPQPRAQEPRRGHAQRVGPNRLTSH